MSYPINYKIMLVFLWLYSYIILFYSINCLTEMPINRLRQQIHFIKFLLLRGIAVAFNVLHSFLNRNQYKYSILIVVSDDNRLLKASIVSDIAY